MYEGVITGADICKWLVQCQYKFAQDSAEACIIGQELVGCGLLIPVCCGYEDFGYDDDEVRLLGYLLVWYIHKLVFGCLIKWYEVFVCG